MKALTICQPYAHLIALPDDDDRAKRVENRTWETLIRGDVLIHAGKSRSWLDLDATGSTDNSGIKVSEMAFGAIVGVANIVDCFHVAHTYERAVKRYPWLETHQHVSGPFCFVLADVRPLLNPIPFRGAQKFFNVPRNVVESVRLQLKLLSRS